MPRRALLSLLSVVCWCGMAGPGTAAPALDPQLSALQAPQLWRRAEFGVAGLPSVANPFDPDLLRVDAVFTGPSGRTWSVPAFWFQEYTRALVEGAEVLTAKGAPGWRLRFTPTEAGAWSVRLSVGTNTAAATEAGTPFRFHVPARTINAPHGWVRNAADKQSLETSVGRPLRLIGENVCWDDGGGTFEFDHWFGSLHRAGANFARLWLSPWAIGLEHGPGTLTNYPLGDAWQLDHLFDLAERSGLYLLIAFDHHGMYQVDNQNWGGSNNFWPTHNPYNAALGGPCLRPNDFFTNPQARRIYQKRLRYLIARWGYSPNLLAWQFFNEIDNVYAPRGDLVGDDVAAWHREMAQWLRAHDPFGHLITTSLTGGSDRPEIWTLPEMDFSMYHSYNEANPGRRLAALSRDFVQRYAKPVMVGEFGVDARSWNIASDPHLRGFRQALWGTALGGSVGSAMSWWWQDIHTHEVYPLFGAMKAIVDAAKWREGDWRPMEISRGPLTPPELGEALAGGGVFNAQFSLNSSWRAEVPGAVAVADRLSADRAAESLSSYLQGDSHAARQRTMRLTAHFASGARLVLRANAVATGAELVLAVDGVEKSREALPDLDGQASANGEYNREFALAIPAGRHVVEIHNAGRDWVFIDQLRLEKVREARFADGRGWTPEAVGLRSGNKGLLYAWSPWVAFPAGALRFHPPPVGGEVVSPGGWADGRYRVRWFETRAGRGFGTTDGRATGGQLKITLPELREDAVAIIEPAGPAG